MTKPTIDHLKMVASIIEYRCNNILQVRKMLEDDILALYRTRSQKTRDKICGDIYNKLEYIETLLSKNIDDVMSVEIMEMDSMDKEKHVPFKLADVLKDDEYTHYIQ